jgi:hypothetical protein
MSYLLNFKFRFKGRLKDSQRASLKKAVESLKNPDTEISISRLCRTRLEGTISKPSYNKIGKRPNSRNSFALIKKVKSIAEVEESSISVIEDTNNSFSFINKKDPGKIPGGLADGKTPRDLSERHGVKLEDILLQLKKGIKVEMEHTDDKEIAREIAMDHVFEDPNYYDKLKKIEEKEYSSKSLNTAGGAALSGVGGLALGAGAGYLAGRSHKKDSERYEQSYKSKEGELKRLKEELSKAKKELRVEKVKSLELRIGAIEGLRKKAAESKLKYKKSIKTGAAIGTGVGLATFGAKKLMDKNEKSRNKALKEKFKKNFEESDSGKSLRARQKANAQKRFESYRGLDNILDEQGVSKDNPLRSDLPTKLKDA